MKKIVTTIVMSMALAVAAYATSAHADDTRGICRLAGKYAELAAIAQGKGESEKAYLDNLKDIDKTGAFYYLQNLVGNIVFSGKAIAPERANLTMREMCIDDTTPFVNAYQKGQM